MPTSSNHKHILYPSSASAEPDIHQLRRLFNDLEAIAQIPNPTLDITINFQYCNFLNHIAVACLGGLARLIQSRDGRVVFDWETLPREIHMNLAQSRSDVSVYSDRGNFAPQSPAIDNASYTIPVLTED